MAIHPSCMVLEFLLRHNGVSHLLHRILLVLPLPPPPLPPPLPKLILLRRIAASPVSDAALFALELIHQHNLASHAYSRAPSLLPLIQSAYLHAAVGSTLVPLRRGDLPEFLDAVERTWRMRVWDLEASEGSGLVSFGLLEWKGRMEAAAAGGREARDEVLNGWGDEEGTGAVMAYWAREMELMGPTTVEMAAEACLRGLGGGGPGDEAINDDEMMREWNLDGSGGGAGGEERGRGRGERMEVEENLDGLGGGPGDEERGGGQGEQMEVEENSNGLGGVEKTTSARVEQGEVGDNDNGDRVLVRSREASDGLGGGEMRAEGAVEQVEMGVISVGTNIVRTSSVSTLEVNKVKEDLRRSLEDLQNVVEDPLPNAKEIASRVIASKSIDMMPLQEPVENHSQEPEGNQTIADDSVLVRCADKASAVIHTGSTGVYIELNKNPKKVSGHNLMDRNPTAWTYRWEDESIESASNNAASPSKRLRLPSPRKTKVSPLKPVEDKQGPKKRRKFSLEEEETLREAVKKYGQGNWKTILSNYRDAFQGRTEGNLKDKWRNMTK